MYLRIFKLKLWMKTIKLRSLCQNQHFTQNQLPTTNRQLKLVTFIYLVYGFSIQGLNVTALSLLHSGKIVIYFKFADTGFIPEF